ncbi:MAG: DUF262 domain-containing HNH endonuclease family protein [Sedimentisphaerales bacterium]|nr:DUF262 domain-containing HNH endonuclease family protein [Sedimentisphaerales bacterium]
MAQKIDSDKLLVKDVLQKWYRIPEYQRPYVWETDQVVELLDDVYQARKSNPDSQYFLGSLVLKRNEKNDGKSEYEEFDLLDGQQRIITLFLITAVVRDLTPQTNVPRLKTCSETIFQMANPDDNVPERLRIVFDIRDKVKEFVNNYVKQDKGTSKIDELRQLMDKRDEDISIRNMATAILTIRNYFQNGKSLDEFFPYLRSHVLMIYVAAGELEDAFHLFTVMNNRGIKLRNSDILKAENLSKVKDVADRTRYAKKWESIEEYFGEDFDNYLSHLRTILVKRKAGYNLLKEYEENIYNPRDPLLAKGKNTFDFIDKYFQHYTTLFDENNYGLTNSFEFYNRIALMRQGLEADYWIAALLRYYDKFKTINLLQFLKALDNKFSADWITGLTPTARIQNTNAIIQKIDDAQNSDEIIGADILKINANDFIRVLSGGIYGRRYARYLLLKLDSIYQGYTTKLAHPATISIEHILPQNPDESSQWMKDFDFNERIKWTDRIGNLVLISRKKNTSQSNYDFAKKKEKYFKGNIELFSNSVRVYQKFNSWKLDALKENHKEVLLRLFAEYGITLQDDELNNLLEN